jgi:hypothetical protein
VIKLNEEIRGHLQRLATTSYFGGSACSHRGQISFGRSDLAGSFSQSFAIVAKWVSERSRKAPDLITIRTHCVASGILILSLSHFRKWLGWDPFVGGRDDR